jgi:hypothetical protein
MRFGIEVPQKFERRAIRASFGGKTPKVKGGILGGGCLLRDPNLRAGIKTREKKIGAPPFTRS